MRGMRGLTSRRDRESPRVKGWFERGRERGKTDGGGDRREWEWRHDAG